MDDIFKRNLLKLRKGSKPQTFAEAILDTTIWGKEGPIPTALPKSPESFTEKGQVLESLERFAQENVKPVLKVEGGEVAVKPDPVWDVQTHTDLQDLFRDLPHGELNLKNKRPGEIQVLFVTEAFRPIEEAQSEFKNEFLDELVLAFPFKTAEFFERMLKAMKLLPQETIVYSCEEGMKVAAHFKPEIIVTLGAQATQFVLKGQERLSQVHGQFFQRKIEGIGSFTIVPLFHPSILETNQNMKKTAWADMQKIMKHLKKLP